jgi:hypothetical protein
MFADPTIDDFSALIDWHIAKAQEQATQGVEQVRREAARLGRFQSGKTVQDSIEGARIEFDAGVEAVLAELKRVAQSTKLNLAELRQIAVQRLERFAIAAKETSKAEQFRNTSAGVSRFIDEQFAAFDQHLQFSVRQFSVGLLNPPYPELPPIMNSITVGNMTNSALVQGSPGAQQTMDVTLNIQSAGSALADFESAVSTVALPPKAMEELRGDIQTIRSQLQKPSPSHLIIQEAGKSLRNVVEGVAGGMLTPVATTAALALWSALGLG